MIKTQDLPDGWRELKLSEILETLENGNRPKGGIKEIKNGIPSFGGEHLNSNGGFNFHKIKLIPINYYDSLRRGKIRIEDVLVVKDGATTGKTSFVSNDFPYQEASVNEHVFILRGKKELINPKFLFYHLFSPYGQRQIMANFHGAAIGGINTQFVKNYILILPPLPTQKKIVAILDKAEKLKGWRREADELTDELLKSTFLEMFGDPVKNPNGWDIKKLGDICTLIKDGPHVSPNYTNKGIPFITVHNIINGFFDLSNVRYISEIDYNEFCKRCKPEKGDVLYTKGGTTGFAKRIEIDFEFSIWVHLALLKFPKELLNDIFLEACLNSNFCKVQAKRYTRGIANRDLVLSQIAKIKIIVPPVDVQQKFADFVKKIELVQEHQTQSSQHIEDLFDVLMQQAFRGELS